MTVSFQNFAQTGSGLSQFTFFQDDFNRINTVNNIGQDWWGVRPNPNIPGVYSDYRINTNQLQSFNQNLGDSNPGTIWFPRRLISAVWGKSQFAQITVTAITVSLFPRSGLAVMITPIPTLTTFTAYTVAFEDAVTCSINLRAQGAFLPLAGPLVYAIGDIMRFRVTPTVAANTLELYRNGVLISSVVDASANRPIQTGIPGMYAFNGDTTDTTTFDNFSGGLG